jgi:hypothetical protein
VEPSRYDHPKAEIGWKIVSQQKLENLRVLKDFDERLFVTAQHKL